MWQWSSGVLCPLLLPLSLSFYEARAGVCPAFCTRSLTYAHARIELCILILPYAIPYLPSALCIIPVSVLPKVQKPRLPMLWPSLGPAYSYSPFPLSSVSQGSFPCVVSCMVLVLVMVMRMTRGT
jgi:hypothetical protein